MERASLDKIDDKLYLGDMDDAANKRALQQANITAIVRVLPRAFSHVEGITYFDVPVNDFPSENIAQYLSGAIQFIYDQHQAGQNVFIHCAAGISRSSTVATAYLMTMKNVSCYEALAFIRRSRPIATPNQGFQQQLQRFNVANMRQRLGLT